jgi:hypothetical protein
MQVLDKRNLLIERIKKRQIQEMIKMKTEELRNKNIHIWDRYKKHLMSTSKNLKNVKKNYIKHKMHFSLPERIHPDFCEKTSLNDREMINGDVGSINISSVKDGDGKSSWENSFEKILKNKTRNDTITTKREESVAKPVLPNLSQTRSPSILIRKKEHNRMLSTIAPFESLAKTSSRVVIEELFKGSNNNSTITNPKFPWIGFEKQLSRKSLINLKENPHEERFSSINRFPSILSTNKNTNSLVSWDQGRKSNPSRRIRASKDWLVNQIAKKKKGYIHKFKKKDLILQNQNHLLL